MGNVSLTRQSPQKTLVCFEVMPYTEGGLRYG